MAGRIRRKLIQFDLAQSPIGKTKAVIFCPLCEREIPTAQRDAHHLVPKSKGGRETRLLHRLCHRQIHALFTENELANQYNHVEKLLSHPEIFTFINWVKTKPISFIERSRKSQRIRPK